MKSHHVLLLGLFAILSSFANASIYYPQRMLADQSTGYMESKIGSNWFRGSAVVARDSRLIYSCGHLFFDNGIWASEQEFYRAYNGSVEPDPNDGVIPRGYRYFTSYGDNADTYGQDSSRAFAYDFTVFYGADSFGPAATCWVDGVAAATSAQKKRIVGYPATVDYTRRQGYAYQHATPWFPTAARQTRGAFYEFKDVSTGEGNSGGPLFVMDGGSGNYSLAGILVSGSTDSAGIYALNGDSDAMASAALGVKTITGKFSDANSTALPDAAAHYTTRTVTSSGFAETLTNLKFSVSISTPRRGDLDVYLVSPSGRVRWVKKHSTSTSKNLDIAGADYSTSFAGYAPNGTWKLKMRDSTARNLATYNRFAVAVTAPAP